MSSNVNENAFCGFFFSYALYDPYVLYDASFRAYAFSHIHISHFQSDHDVHDAREVHAYYASHGDGGLNDDTFTFPTD
jgi:hypothetical protein